MRIPKQPPGKENRMPWTLHVCCQGRGTHQSLKKPSQTEKIIRKIQGEETTKPHTPRLRQHHTPLHHVTRTHTQSKSCSNSSQTKGEAIHAAEGDGAHLHAHFLCSYFIWKCSCFADWPLDVLDCAPFLFLASKDEAAKRVLAIYIYK